MPAPKGGIFQPDLGAKTPKAKADLKAVWDRAASLTDFDRKDEEDDAPAANPGALALPPKPKK
jgi:hypothetical protein